MDMIKVCITEQKILIGYLKSKGDSKLLSTPTVIYTRLIESIRKSIDPTLSDYLANKGKSSADIALSL